ncbi:MAG: ELM1/GtrOC1 family putative glycosyltransferase [Planctomycetota bacterium]|nr:ELM1/GtrOC1 family putative glycosyltransferase [Planctomycetota bacterium]MDA1211250.1 ELM1/GtrOC1 family putative glycosyltransferase [Planctomycetota bacterium]
MNSTSATTRLILWSIRDEKPGHFNQLRGLIRALSDRVAVEVHSLSPPSFVELSSDLIRRRFRAGESLPQPDLILGAGHATHLALLTAGRATGAKTVLLMKPSVPCRWFDMCLIPDHDLGGTPPVGNRQTIVTRGVLNAIVPSHRQEANRGLLLIGGRSAHYEWSNDEALSRVTKIVETESQVQWRLTTSRRTPAELVKRLQSLSFSNLVVYRGEETPSDWLPDQLQRAGKIWVTEESVSMVYEALTAGGAVGVLPVPRISDTRVSRGVMKLIDQGWVTSFDDWQTFGDLTPSRETLSEADRCAVMILDRWFARHLSQQQKTLDKAA